MPTAAGSRSIIPCRVRIKRWSERGGFWMIERATHWCRPRRGAPPPPRVAGTPLGGPIFQTPVIMGSRLRGNDTWRNRLIEGNKVFMPAKRPPALDRIDVKILAALQRDGRSTIQKLAQAVGLSPRASLERVRRLEAAGVIAGYQAVVELARFARPVNVFAEIIL